MCAREPHNSHDHYAVAVKRDSSSDICQESYQDYTRMFTVLRPGGVIFRVVTGGTQ